MKSIELELKLRLNIIYKLTFGIPTSLSRLEWSIYKFRIRAYSLLQYILRYNLWEDEDGEFPPSPLVNI